ncbi:uncharacterized protein [Macaca nemestrina]|uniref:uncharacterized protein isoform X1 n=1 Tax=Macaca nemestrina TaxID=9545 RepID=UPI0005F4D8E1|nr:uncharacterized protein LOC105476221 isoform X2 [Macaca nemestrina]
MDGPEGQYAKGNKPVPRTLTDFPTRMWVIAQRSSVVMKESDSTAETPHSILRRVKWRNASEQTTHQGCGSCCYSEKEHLRGEKDTPEAFARSLFPETDSAEDVMWIRITGTILHCFMSLSQIMTDMEHGNQFLPKPVRTILDKLGESAQKPGELTWEEGHSASHPALFQPCTPSCSHPHLLTPCLQFLSNIWNTEELITCCVDGLSLLSYLETGRKSVPGIQRPPMERHDLHWVFRT